MARQPPAPNELDALEQHIRELERQSKALLAEEIALEKANVHPIEPRPGTTPAERVQRFMNGFASLGLVDSRPRGERLFGIIQDRIAIGDAVRALEEQRIRLEGARDDAAAEARAPAHQKLCTEIVLLRDRLMHKEQQASAVPHSIRHRLPMSEFIGVRPLVNWTADPNGEARREALRLGFITARDLEATKNV